MLLTSQGLIIQKFSSLLLITFTEVLHALSVYLVLMVLRAAHALRGVFMKEITPMKQGTRDLR